MKLGAMDNVLSPTIAEAFVRAKRLGLDGVEVSLSIQPLVAGDRSAIDAARIASGDSQLPITSAVLGEHNAGGVASWWRGKAADDEVRVALDACHALGCRDLLVPFFFFNELKGKTHRENAAERIRPLAMYAESIGARFCFEGVNPAEELLEIAAAVDCPAFGVYFDPANVTWCDCDPVEQAKALGSKLFRSHLKEAKIFTGDVRLGQGRVNHRDFALALKSIGYDGWLVLETPPGSDSEIQRDIDFARSVYG